MPSRSELKGQDWTPVALTVRAPPPARTGRPQHAPQTTSTGMVASRLENDSETLKHASVPLSLQRAILSARTAKNVSQKQLAQQMSVPVATISEYERGACVPNNAFIAKLERQLGVKLPRAAKPGV